MSPAFDVKLVETGLELNITEATAKAMGIPTDEIALKARAFQLSK